MNTRAMVANLNELDQQLCDTFGIPRAGDATTLDEAITMSAATTERLVTRERNVGDDAGSPIGQSPLTEFLQAQVEARQMRARDRVDVVRSLNGRHPSHEEGRIVLQGLGARPVRNFAKCSASTARCCRSSKTRDSSSRNPTTALAAPP